MNKRTACILPRMRLDGVKLLVELELDLDQFTKLLEHGFGWKPNDDELVEFRDIFDRRILPNESGSYSGIGFDVNEIVKAAITPGKESHENQTNTRGPLPLDDSQGHERGPGH